jgi:cellobiose-specific phosphotransferase system component IIC
MFDLVINIFIILFIIFFTSIIIQKQQQGDTLEEIWQKYQNNMCTTRTTLKIIGIIFICWLSTVHLVLGILTAILLIVIMEYDYNNEIDKTENFQSIDKTSTGDTEQNKLHKKKNKVDYFIAEKSVQSKQALGADKSLFKSLMDIKPYDVNTDFVSV